MLCFKTVLSKYEPAPGFASVLAADVGIMGLFLVVQTVKNRPAKQETWVQSLGWEDSLEDGMTTHSSILAWRIPWTEEPGRLQSMGSQRVRLSSVQPANGVGMRHGLPASQTGWWRSQQQRREMGLE